MTAIDIAHKITRSAKGQLQKLLDQAVEQSRYQDISKLADILAALDKIDDSASSRSGKQSNSVQNRILRSKSMTDVTQQALLETEQITTPQEFADGKHPDYPMFATDMGQLVKVGWSKKHTTEYEHRIARRNVEWFITEMTSTTKDGEIFDMDKFTPNFETKKLPVYQVYVALAWLIDIGIIQKVGRGRYVIRDRTRIKENFDHLWNKLKTREVKHK